MVEAEGTYKVRINSTFGYNITLLSQADANFSHKVNRIGKLVEIL